MKKNNLSGITSTLEKKNIRRKGIHAKTKTSLSKGSKLYKKLSIGQGN